MYSIESYTSKDYSEVASWAKDWLRVDVPQGFFCEDGTFILSIDNVPALCITVLKTQCKDMAYLFNYIKNPIFREVSLEKYGSILWTHCYAYAKQHGYSRLVCFSDSQKLSDKYQRYGMTITSDKLNSFVKFL